MRVKDGTQAEEEHCCLTLNSDLKEQPAGCKTLSKSITGAAASADLKHVKHSKRAEAFT